MDLILAQHMHTVEHYGLLQFLTVSAWLFALGIATMLWKRNAIAVLMGIELILNAANLNFVAFARYRPSPGGITDLNGHMFAIFVIILAAAEAGVGLAIVVNYVNRFKTVDVNQANLLKG